MSAGRCQICGCRKYLRKRGVIAHHGVGGPVCPGAGHPPIERDDARLIGYAAQVNTAYERAREAVRRLEDARANWIDPALIVRRGLLAGLKRPSRRRSSRRSGTVTLTSHARHPVKSVSTISRGTEGARLHGWAYCEFADPHADEYDEIQFRALGLRPSDPPQYQRR